MNNDLQALNFDPLLDGHSSHHSGQCLGDRPQVKGSELHDCLEGSKGTTLPCTSDTKTSKIV